MALMGKPKAFALNVVDNEIWQSIGEHFLSSKLMYNWVSNTTREDLVIY
jgi:hypothetical protein